jgi:hypothetical protein
MAKERSRIENENILAPTLTTQQLMVEMYVRQGEILEQLQHIQSQGWMR